jgi:hypothetical protein
VRANRLICNKDDLSAAEFLPCPYLSSSYADSLLLRVFICVAPGKKIDDRAPICIEDLHPAKCDIAFRLLKMALCNDVFPHFGGIVRRACNGRILGFAWPVALEYFQMLRTFLLNDM